MSQEGFDQMAQHKGNPEKKHQLGNLHNILFECNCQADRTKEAQESPSTYAPLSMSRRRSDPKLMYHKAPAFSQHHT